MSAAGRHRSTASHSSAEEQALNRIARDGEDCLARRRQARAEARLIRIRELERQQRDADHDSDRHYERGGASGQPLPRVSSSSAALSESPTRKNSGEHERHKESLAEELSRVKEKFERAMVLFSQLDNEKSQLNYELQLTQERLEEAEELLAQANRDSKDSNSHAKLLQRDLDVVQQEQRVLLGQLAARDQIILDAGLVILEDAETVNLMAAAKSTSSVPMQNGPTSLLGGDAGGGGPTSPPPPGGSMVLSQQTLQSLERLCPEAGATVDRRIQALIGELKQLRLERDEYSRLRSARLSSPEPLVGDYLAPGSDLGDSMALDLAKDANKQLGEFKFKLQELSRENTKLQGDVIRLESQVKRYRGAAEVAEREVGELKAARRQMQKEMRETQNSLDEQRETAKHLQQRLDKLKASRARIT